MPQMAPMSWLTLFEVFTVTFIMFSIMNYYITTYPPFNMDKKKEITKKINWKW
uniref:ATP synthase complex subunit 8 n=1 Tax=Agrilinae sp. 1 ACP-2013 TaxID=1434404 RepID=A0A3G5FNU3_9COLE|nr:ATP synthase F0 subunit 8 [Agrilinae sp. 1 ACP-2013]